MKLFIKAAAVLLAAAIALTGCAGGDTSWAFKSGNIQIPAGLYIIYQIKSFTDAEQKLTDENSGNSEYSLPERKKLFSETIEGQPAADWINEKAQEGLREYVAVLQKFDALGLTLTDSEIRQAENNVASIKSQSGDLYEKNGVSDASLKEYYTFTAKKDRLFSALYGEGGEFAVSDEMLKARFSEKYAVIDALFMEHPTSVPEGETRTLEELASDVKTVAEGYIEKLKSGEEFEQIMYDWDLRKASGPDKEAVQKPEKGSSRLVISEESRSSLGDKLTDAFMASKIGTPEIVEDTGYSMLINRVDSLADLGIFEDYRIAVMREMKYDEFEQKLAEWGVSVELEANDAALARYKPGKIKFD